MNTGYTSPHLIGESSEYRTHDLYFAAFLQTAGVPLADTVRESGGRKVAFVFDTRTTNLPELKTTYYNQTARIPALPYANNIKSLKALCHQG